MKISIIIPAVLFGMTACAAPAPKAWTPKTVTTQTAPKPQRKIDEIPHSLDQDLDKLEKEAEAHRVAERYAEAGKAYAVLCKNDRANACALFGVVLEVLDSSPKGSKAAMNAYVRACELGAATGCLYAAKVAERLNDIAGARKLYELGCATDTTIGANMACAHLASMLADGIAGPRDAERARSLATRACSVNVGSGCQELATMYLDGFGGAKDPERAVELLTNRCDQKDADACTTLAWAYAKGRGITKDLKMAAAVSKKACDNGVANACLVDGELAQEEWTTTGAKRALKSFSAACDLKMARGCRSAGDVAKLQLRNKDTALNMYRKGCRSDDAEACRLGSELAKGEEVLAMAEHSCRLKSGDGCAAEAKIWVDGIHVKQDLSRARRRLRKGVELGSARALHDSSLYRLTGADGAKPNYDKAQAGFRRACLELNYGMSCIFVAASYVEKGEFKRAKEFLETGCQTGDTSACVAYGESLTEAKYGEVDEAAALAIFLRACDRKSGEGCSALGWLMATSESLAIRDGKKAVRYAKRALRFGSDIGVGGDSFVYQSIAAGYAAQGRFKMALKYAYRALKHHKRNFPTLEPKELEEQIGEYKKGRLFRRS